MAFAAWVLSPAGAQTPSPTRPNPEPELLLYSDDPEVLHQDGVMLQSTNPVALGHAQRVYFYHANGTPVKRRVSLVLRAEMPGTQVRITGADVGPEGEYYLDVGHKANVAYLLATRAPQDGVVTIEPGIPYVKPLGAALLDNNASVVAIEDVSVIAGGPVEIAVVNTTGEPDAGALPQNLLQGDGHSRQGAFSLSLVPPIILVGSTLDTRAQNLPVGSGLDKLKTQVAPDSQNTAHILRGEYGVVRSFLANLANPTDVPMSLYAYLAVNGQNNYTNATIWFDGDPAPLATPCIGPAAGPYLLREFQLAPNSTRTVTGLFMTDGGATLPIDFGITTSRPQALPARDHCARGGSGT